MQATASHAKSLFDKLQTNSVEEEEIRSCGDGRRCSYGSWRRGPLSRMKPSVLPFIWSLAFIGYPI